MPLAAIEDPCAICWKTSESCFNFHISDVHFRSQIPVAVFPSDVRGSVCHPNRCSVSSTSEFSHIDHSHTLAKHLASLKVTEIFSLTHFSLLCLT